MSMENVYYNGLNLRKYQVCYTNMEHFLHFTWHKVLLDFCVKQTGFITKCLAEKTVSPSNSHVPVSFLAVTWDTGSMYFMKVCNVRANIILWKKKNAHIPPLKHHLFLNGWFSDLWISSLSHCGEQTLWTFSNNSLTRLGQVSHLLYTIFFLPQLNWVIGGLHTRAVIIPKRAQKLKLFSSLHSK